MLKFEDPPAQVPARLLIPLVLFGILLLTTGCVEANPENAAAQSVYYDIDPFFEHFYDLIGGETILGPAITPIFTRGNVSYQYTVAGLMGYNPEAPAHQRYFLGSIGMDLGVLEPAILEPAYPLGRYQDGHVIFDEFIPLYDRLGGKAIVGKPITEIHYNPNVKRFEQHFENLGFYRLLTDSPGTARLLAYGIYKCASSCQANAEVSALVTKPADIDPRFLTGVARLGPDLTGHALKEGYTTPDGYLEQVFANIVLISDPAQPERIMLRPITVRLGIHPDPLENPALDEETEFYSLQGDLGYNVLKAFSDYISYHGGQEASGPPISRLTNLDETTLRQCFLNLCLDLYRRDNFAPLILPAPLGFKYQDLELEAVLPNVKPTQENGEKAPAPTATHQQAQEVQGRVDRGAHVQVWERYPLLAAGTSQEITVLVTQDNVPLRMVETYLIIDLPDGGQLTEYLLPTGTDGQSTILLGPLPASNGALITYSACAFHPKGQVTCTNDGFLVSDSP